MILIWAPYLPIKNCGHFIFSNYQCQNSIGHQKAKLSLTERLIQAKFELLFQDFNWAPYI